MAILTKTRVGETFNYLTIIEYIPIKKTYLNKERGERIVRVAYYKCRCVCGNEKIIASSSVINGSIKSCGCKKKELCVNAVKKHYEIFSDPVERRLFGSYKKEKRRIFSLSFDDFKKLVNSNCHYCGSEPFLLRGNKTKSKTKLLNGIDRIDSSIGYEINNCVPCCIICNRAKNAMSLEDFISWIKKISKYKFWNNN